MSQEFERVIDPIVLLLLALISKTDERSIAEMKTASNRAPDGLLTLANGFWSEIVMTWYLYWDIIELYVVRNYFISLFPLS